MTDLNRRSFLGSAAFGVPLYSVLVNAEGAEPPLMPETPQPAAFNEVVGKPSAWTPEPNMPLTDLACDVFIAGGGMAGVIAALSAARNGASVVLVQDRSRLGGNASSEIKMHIVGADCHGSRAGWREGGVLEELRLDDAVHNSRRAYEMWDLLLYDKCVSQPGLSLLLDSTIYAVEMKDAAIDRALVRCDKTETLYRIAADVFCDCTGDGRLALEAGAEVRRGRESKAQTGESLALDKPDGRSQGSSILFTSRQHDQPVPFKAPSWARKITKEHLKFRGVHAWEYGYWWIELGGMYDTIRDNERLRFELLAIVLGVWDHIKNSGEHPSSASWALETVGMIPGKRESRRVVGDHVMDQMDLEGGWKKHSDGVAIGGWNFDEHPPEGFNAPDKRPFVSIKIPEVYNIPLGSLYSRNIPNLMMAGRNISSTHVAFTSARVMGTCSSIGQATGTAAAYCSKHGLTPRELRSTDSHLRALQQVLLRDDQSIRGIRDEDPLNLARDAVVSASSIQGDALPEHVTNGYTRDTPGSLANRWRSEKEDVTPWIQLEWSRPRRIGLIQITFDSGFHRELTLSAANHVTRGTVRGPQPETIRDYRLIGRDTSGEEIVLAEVTANHQRLRRHEFDSRELKSVRLEVHATNGTPEARLYEIRCYERRVLL